MHKRITHPHKTGAQHDTLLVLTPRWICTEERKTQKDPSDSFTAIICCIMQGSSALSACSRQSSAHLPPDPLTLHAQTACDPIHFSCTLQFLLSSICVYVIPLVKLLADAARQAGMLRGVCCPSSLETSISRVRQNFHQKF